MQLKRIEKYFFKVVQRSSWCDVSNLFELRGNPIPLSLLGKVCNRYALWPWTILTVSRQAVNSYERACQLVLEKSFNRALDHRGYLRPHFRAPALFRYTTEGRRFFLSLFLLVYRVTYRGRLHRYVRVRR